MTTDNTNENTETYLEKEFNSFIQKWCGNMYPHLIDTDENDGEKFRQIIRQEIDQLRRDAKDEQALIDVQECQKKCEQVRRDAVEEYKKEYNEIPLIQEAFKEGKLEAKKELLDELILLCSAYTNDNKDMYEIIDYMKGEIADVEIMIDQIKEHCTWMRLKLNVRINRHDKLLRLRKVLDKLESNNE